MTEIADFERKWLESCDKMAPAFSTCSKRQYFSVVIGSNKRLLSQGYNGSPPNYGHCNEGFCPRAQQNSPNGSNYDNCIANHAEANALLWCDPHARVGATLIVNGPPCYSCAKLIACSGITRVIGYFDSNYAQQDQVVAFLNDCDIECILVQRETTYAGWQQLNTYSGMRVVARCDTSGNIMYRSILSNESLWNE